MKSPDLVIIEWVDASAQEALEQHNKESADKISPIIISDVGWIISDKPTHIVIASEDAAEGEFRHVSTIPKLNILTLHFLQRGRKTSKYDFRPENIKRKKRTRK